VDGTLFTALQQPAFTALGAPVSWNEAVGDVTGLLCVALLAKKHIANWPIGILNNLFFLLMFWSAKLYADASLQLVFAALGVYGWWSWQRGGAMPETLRIRRTAPREWAWLAALAVLGQAATTLWLSHHTDSPVPFFDASILVLSLVATYGQARKVLESWWVWIVVDLISMPVYVSRHLYATALVYFVFLCLCILGLRAWQRSLAVAA
jgi:nicotinamide mononucleotide transporter